MFYGIQYKKKPPVTDNKPELYVLLELDEQFQIKRKFYPNCHNATGIENFIKISNTSHIQQANYLVALRKDGSYVFLKCRSEYITSGQTFNTLTDLREVMSFKQQYINGEEV